MSVKRILLLDHAAALGGAEHSLLLFLAGLDRRSWEPVLGCFPGALRDAARELAVETVEFEFPRLRRSPQALLDLFTKSRRIAACALEGRIDLLYANTVRSAIYGSMAARSLAVPFVWHMRDFWLSEREPVIPGLDRLGKSWIGARADAILANSHAVAEHLPFAEKVSVVHNGVDPHRYQPKPDDGGLKARFNIPVDRPVVGMAGRLRPWKGADRFIRAAAEISRADPETYYLIVGGSPFDVRDGYAESLPRLAGRLSIADKVVFTGHLEDIRPALAAMDIFVHPGDPEPFGLVNIEAMAMGKPVVAFAHGALPEIVADRQTGILIPPGDLEALVSAVLDLLHSPGKTAEMGRAGRKRVEANFTAKKMTKAIDAILAKLVVAGSVRTG